MLVLKCPKMSTNVPRCLKTGMESLKARHGTGTNVRGCLLMSKIVRNVQFFPKNVLYFPECHKMSANVQKCQQTHEMPLNVNKCQ